MTKIDKGVLIYKTGVKLFRKYGPRKVSIDMIIKDAGVGKGTFYLYFKNKEELYEKIIGNIVEKGKQHKKELVKTFSDPKERLMVDLLSSLDFFYTKEGIISNLMQNNPNFYLGKVDKDFLENLHLEMVSLLFSDILDDIFKNNKKLLSFSLSLFGFYKYAVSLKNMYKTEEEFRDFMTKLAYFFVEGIFDEKFQIISDIKYITYENKVKPFVGKVEFMKKY